MRLKQTICHREQVFLKSSQDQGDQLSSQYQVEILKRIKNRHWISSKITRFYWKCFWQQFSHSHTRYVQLFTKLVQELVSLGSKHTESNKYWGRDLPCCTRCSKTWFMESVYEQPHRLGSHAKGQARLLKTKATLEQGKQENKQKPLGIHPQKSVNCITCPHLNYVVSR